MGCTAGKSANNAVVAQPAGKTLLQSRSAAAAAAALEKKPQPSRSRSLHYEDEEGPEMVAFVTDASAADNYASEVAQAEAAAAEDAAAAAAAREWGVLRDGDRSPVHPLRSVWRTAYHAAGEAEEAIAHSVAAVAHAFEGNPQAAVEAEARAPEEPEVPVGCPRPFGEVFELTEPTPVKYEMVNDTTSYYTSPVVVETPVQRVQHRTFFFC